MTTRLTIIVIADTGKMLGDFKEGKVTSVWGSALQTADAVRGLNEGKEEVRERGPLENLGSNCIHGVRRTRIKGGGGGAGHEESREQARNCGRKSRDSSDQ